MLDARPTNSSGSDGSGNSSHSGRGDKEDRDALKGIVSGTVGGGLGPYAVSLVFLLSLGAGAMPADQPPRRPGQQRPA